MSGRTGTKLCCSAGGLRASRNRTSGLILYVSHGMKCTDPASWEEFLVTLFWPRPSHGHPPPFSAIFRHRVRLHPVGERAEAVRGETSFTTQSLKPPAFTTRLQMQREQLMDSHTLCPFTHVYSTHSAPSSCPG